MNNNNNSGPLENLAAFSICVLAGALVMKYADWKIKKLKKQHSANIKQTL